jgi:deazaflavin-dependent oxidoreductase (nitroreductase family)
MLQVNPVGFRYNSVTGTIDIARPSGTPSSSRSTAAPSANRVREGLSHNDDRGVQMSFDTRNGTRGARQPRAGRLMRWVNERATSRIRRKGGKFMGFNALILTTIGAKSGTERSNPVGWFPAGDNNSWLIVASAAGAPKNPAWYYNIAAHPDKIQIEIAGRKIPVTATQLHGPERQEAWSQITTAAPRFAQYQTKTDRELPIIRLTTRPD